MSDNTAPNLLDGYLSEADTATQLKVQVPTLRNWRSAERGPPWTRINGRTVVYPVDGARRWLSINTCGATHRPTMSTGRRASGP